MRVKSTFFVVEHGQTSDLRIITMKKPPNMAFPQPLLWANLVGAT
jgi:hypothetical protein